MLTSVTGLLQVYLSRREDSSREEPMHVLQELTLSRRRVAHNAHIYVPPQLDTLRRLLVDPAQQHEKHTTFHLEKK